MLIKLALFRPFVKYVFPKVRLIKEDFASLMIEDAGGDMTEDLTPVALENQAVRRHFDETEEKWYFSVIVVLAVLTGSANPRDYWFKMKTRVKSEDGIELSTICRQLKRRQNC